MTSAPAPFSASETEQTPDIAIPAYRVVRFKDPHAALGRSVMQLMGKPGFAQLRFGSWSRVLVGQINRNQYFFLERDGQMVGFAGWSRSSEQKADAWVAGEGDLSHEEALTGDCIIVNVWQSDDPQAQAEMVRQMRLVAHDVRLVYGRRSYGDGRDRFIKMPMSRFVARHISRGTTGQTGPGQDKEESR